MDDNRYMSHYIINELIVLMGQRLLRQMLHNIQHNSPIWYGLMADEATDAANKVQLNVTIRWVDDSYEINEDPIGLFFLPATSADIICTGIKDMLVCCNLVALSLSL